MKKLKIAAGIVLALIVAAYITRLFISEDRANRFSRLGVSYLDGNYKVTYSAYTGDKVWQVKDGKITSEPAKGYYFFWATQEGSKKKRYVQTPINMTVIEELN